MKDWSTGSNDELKWDISGRDSSRGTVSRTKKGNMYHLGFNPTNYEDFVCGVPIHYRNVNSNGSHTEYLHLADEEIDIKSAKKSRFVLKQGAVKNGAEGLSFEWILRSRLLSVLIATTILILNMIIASNMEIRYTFRAISEAAWCT